MWPIIAMSAAGLGLGLLDKRRQHEEEDAQLAKQKYSPWTGLQAREVKRADPLGGAVKGGMAGLGFMSQNGMLGGMGQTVAPGTFGGTPVKGPGFEAATTAADYSNLDGVPDANVVPRTEVAPPLVNRPEDFGEDGWNKVTGQYQGKYNKWNPWGSLSGTGQ